MGCRYLPNIHQSLACVQEDLKALYNKINASEKNLEVVVISADRDQNGFQQTMQGFPWVAVPFGEKRPSIEAKIPCTG
jgi:hypothetical protein